MILSAVICMLVLWALITFIDRTMYLNWCRKAVCKPLPFVKWLFTITFNRTDDEEKTS